MNLQKERDAKEARQLDFEIKRQQGREAKQQLFRRREQERRELSKESADGGDTLNSKEPDKSSQSAGQGASDGQQQPMQQPGGTGRKHKLQIIQSLRQESSTESETQSYTEFRG